jgi:hypothetical protein
MGADQYLRSPVLEYGFVKYVSWGSGQVTRQKITVSIFTK